MDEVEKYQQRLQAIAEKRRLQEEEERAKRQLEEEKLRLQQLKRKSLRDQWLMEGAPLSPNSAGPQSPLWGMQPQQTEAHIDKLQTEIIDRTHKHKEDGSTSAQSHADHHGNERVNGMTPQSALSAFCSTGSSVNRQEKNSDASHDTSLTNGTAPHPEPHNTPLQDVNGISKVVETLLFLGYMEAEPGHGLCDESDDDHVSAVIHAERVIITEEGEEVTLDMPAKEEEVEEREKGGEGKVEEREKGQEEEEMEEKEKGGKGKEEEREKGQEEEEMEEKEKGELKEEEREKGQEEVEKKEKGGEWKEEEREKGQEKEVEEKEKAGEGKEEEREREQEEKGKEEEREKEIEGEKEQVEERETDCKEESAVDVENHPEKWAEADELTELEESLRNNNTDVDSLNQDTKVKTTSHTDEETSADADTHLVRDSATNSASGTDLISAASLAAVPELETPGGAVQTPFGPKTLSASTLNPNGAQKSPNQASTTTTHAAAQFQDIPLGGAMVEEEPLLATKVEPLTDATNRNQADGAKTKTCQCCTIM